MKSFISWLDTVVDNQQKKVFIGIIISETSLIIIWTDLDQYRHFIFQCQFNYSKTSKYKSLNLIKHFNKFIWQLKWFESFETFPSID